MKLPTGSLRKRWINKLSDEDFKSLSPKDKVNYRKYQDSSRLKEGKIITLNKLKERIKELKEEIQELEDSEESNYLKVQHLHNQFNCRIDISRQERKSKSLTHKPRTNVIQKDNGDRGYMGSHGQDTLYIRKTHNGKKLVPHYVYNGKIFTKSINKKSKSFYFQEEKKLIITIKELTNIDLSKSKDILDDVKKILGPKYREYILYLMKKMGSEKFEDYSIKFENFIKWYKLQKVS